jgi:hypothetical protein
MRKLGFTYLIYRLHIDAHGLKIKRRGVAQIFAEGVKAFWTELPGGSFILGFLAFLLASFFENLPGGPSPPPLCIYTGLPAGRDLIQACLPFYDIQHANSN